MKTLAQQLQYVGFPSVTKWEVENNQIRSMSATGMPCLPPIGALLSEIKNPALWFAEINEYEEGFSDMVWFADSFLDSSIKLRKYAQSESNIASGYAGKRFITGYIDTYPSDDIKYGKTPEEALARHYLALKSKQS